MSDTPRTDAATINSLIDGRDAILVDCDFARQLERELNDRNTMLHRITRSWTCGPLVASSSEDTPNPADVAASLGIENKFLHERITELRSAMQNVLTVGRRSDPEHPWIPGGLWPLIEKPINEALEESKLKS